MNTKHVDIAEKKAMSFRNVKKFLAEDANSKDTKNKIATLKFVPFVTSMDI
jgi:hypothetical protein